MKTICVISQMRDEQHLLRQFLDHYEREGAEGIYIIDNGGGATWREAVRRLGHRFTRIKCETPGLQDERKTAKLNEVRRTLAREYEYAVLVDADELVKGKRGTIRSALRAGFNVGFSDVFRTEGWVMTANRQRYDSTMPLTAQFRRGYRHPIDDKPIIVRCSANIEHTPGQHFLFYAIQQAQLKLSQPDPFFLLLHYCAFDKNISHQRDKRNWTRNLPEDYAKGYGDGTPQSDEDFERDWARMQAIETEEVI